MLGQHPHPVEPGGLSRAPSPHSGGGEEARALHVAEGLVLLHQLVAGQMLEQLRGDHAVDDLHDSR